MLATCWKRNIIGGKTSATTTSCENKLRTMGDEIREERGERKIDVGKERVKGE